MISASLNEPLMLFWKIYEGLSRGFENLNVTYVCPFERLNLRRDDSGLVKLNYKISFTQGKILFIS